MAKEIPSEPFSREIRLREGGMTEEFLEPAGESPAKTSLGRVREKGVFQGLIRQENSRGEEGFSGNARTLSGPLFGGGSEWEVHLRLRMPKDSIK